MTRLVVVTALTLIVDASVVLGDVGVGADRNRETNREIQGNSERSRERESSGADRSKERNEGRKAEVVDSKRRDDIAMTKESRGQKESSSQGRKAEVVDSKRRDDIAMTKASRRQKDETVIKEQTPSLVDVKRADEKKVNEMTRKPTLAELKRDEEAKQAPVKPPFTDTPLLQPLNPNNQQSDTAQATSTANSPLGGYAGKTRSRGTKSHNGLDDPSTNPQTDVSYYTGPVEGTVVASYKDTKIGGVVIIEFTTRDGTKWVYKTVHHGHELVKRGDKVGPGQAIGVGAGKGEQFKSSEAGKPHVHWEVERDGRTVNPLTGEVLRQAPTREPLRQTPVREPLRQTPVRGREIPLPSVP